MNCMKHLKPKTKKLSKEAEKLVRNAVHSYMNMSMVVGHEKAMQILKESNKKEETEQ